MPGAGYVWGDSLPGSYDRMRCQSRRMGRCFFYLSALYGRSAPEVEAAQLLLDFAGSSRPSSDQDELSILMTSNGVGVGQVLSAIVDILSESPEGIRTLQEFGSKHRQVLVSSDVLDGLESDLTRLQDRIRNARKSVPV